MRIELNSSSAGGNSGCSSATGKIIMSLFFGVFLFMGLLTTFLMASGFVEEFKASRWIPTSCKIIESSVETGGGDEPYRAIVRYNYNINGQSFFSDRLYYSENSTSDYNGAQAVVLRYPADAPATCLVNPDNHSEAILEAGSYLAFFGVFFPMIFVLVGAGGLYFVWFFKGTSLSGPTARSISKRARPNHGKTVALIVGGAFIVFGGVFSLFFVSPFLQLLDAHNWIETECTIISSDVQSHRGDDSTTYSIEILFEYRWGDTTLRSDRHNFSNWSSSGYDSKQEVVDSYPAGSRALCFVNPDKPFIAVLDRGFQLEYLIGLFPLLFVVVGLALVIFTTKKSTSLARPRGVPTRQAPGTISKMHYTGAVVGPKGSGKTTFLLELKKRLSEKGLRTSYALLRADHKKPYNEALRQLGITNLPHSIIILDGAEQLGFVAWQHFLIRTRLSRGLIISSHSTSRLPTLLECSTSLPLLQELVKQLCPDGYSELQASLPELFKRHKGNIRMCLRDLYDYGINRKPP